MRRLVVHEGYSSALDAPALKRLAGGAYRLISIDAGHSAKTTAHAPMGQYIRHYPVVEGLPALLVMDEVQIICVAHTSIERA